jgi:hypothetical protein
MATQETQTEIAQVPAKTQVLDLLHIIREALRDLSKVNFDVLSSRINSIVDNPSLMSGIDADIANELSRLRKLIEYLRVIMTKTSRDVVDLSKPINELNTTFRKIWNHEIEVSYEKWVDNADAWNTLKALTQFFNLDAENYSGSLNDVINMIIDYVEKIENMYDEVTVDFRLDGRTIKYSIDTTTETPTWLKDSVISSVLNTAIGLVSQHTREFRLFSSPLIPTWIRSLVDSWKAKMVIKRFKLRNEVEIRALLSTNKYSHEINLIVGENTVIDKYKVDETEVTAQYNASTRITSLPTAVKLKKIEEILRMVHDADALVSQGFTYTGKYWIEIS